MYCEYFGLRESPFSIAPNPRYLFMSEQHQEALAHLLYGIRIDGGFVLLTGEVGTGKTTVSRQLIEQLPSAADVALILNPRLNAQELLESICDELRVAAPAEPGPPSLKSLVDRLYRHLLRQHAQGRTTVLIIDEAQQLSPQLLELVRLLTNLETSECKLLKIVLIGQPELLDLLARDDLRQLSQRITARYHLGPLSRTELFDYMRHRLAVAGLERPVFPPATLKQLYRLSGGIPRVINMISDRALLGAYVQKQNSVSVATLKRAAHEVFGDQLPTPRVLFRGRGGLLGGAVLVGILAWAAGLGVSLFASDARLPAWIGSFSALFGAPASEAANPAQAVAHATGAKPLSPVAGHEPASRPPGAASATPLLAAVATGTGSEAGAEQAPAPGNAAIAPDALPVVAPPPVALMAGAAVSQGAVTRAAADAEPVPGSDGIESWPLQSDPDLAQVLAYRKLFRLWGIDYDPRLQPVVCDFARSHGLGCLTLEGDIDLLRQLDTPAVTRLQSGHNSYQVVIQALDRNRARLAVGGQSRFLPLDALRQGWGGSFTILWSLPPGYTAPVWPGASGDTIRWLDVQLARAEGQVMARPETRSYNAAMVERVRQFQQQQGLAVDGVVGPRTLILLNNATRSDLPRLGAPAARL